MNHIADMKERLLDDRLGAQERKHLQEELRKASILLDDSEQFVPRTTGKQLGK